MLLLPIRTSIHPLRIPYANYSLIAINAVIFALTYSPHYAVAGDNSVIEPLRPWAEQFMLNPFTPHLWQFVSFAFLHGSVMHIVGNMFFLYMFGNNVNDRLGNIGFICFYLAGAVFSGVGHALMGGSSAIGASGAVAAVTGAYLVLFPQSLITIVYWFIFIGTMEISALYFIAFKMIFFDNIISRYTPNVAYDAHLAGYAFGIAAMLIMFAAGLLESVHFDLWSMIRMWNRRRKYRAAVAGGYDPFSFEPDSKQVKDVNKPIIPPQQAEKIKQLRDAITSRISQRNLSAAADTYLELADIDGGLVLPRQQLLDIANQLASGGRSAEAARAYEQFLSHYGKYEHAEQVELMLGILYSRYLHHKEHAVKYLRSAIEKLSDPDQLRMCRDELARLQQE